MIASVKELSHFYSAENISNYLAMSTTICLIILQLFVLYKAAVQVGENWMF